MAPKTSSESMTTPSKRRSRKTTDSATSQDTLISPIDLLNPPLTPVSPVRSDFEGDEDLLSPAWRKKSSWQSDALQRHFAQMYEPRQLQEVNDALEMGWNCAICLDTAEDPCVTRCGHMYCKSHITEWLQNNRSCRVCEAPCTIAHDIVPVFAREQPSPLESPSSPASSTSFTRSTSPALSPEFPHVSSQDYFSSKRRGRKGTRIKSSTRFDGTTGYSTMQSSAPPSATSGFAHYIGITFRVVGLALLLGILLPKSFFARSGSAASISHASDL